MTITNFEKLKTDKEYWELANVRNFDAVGNLYSYIIDILDFGFGLNLNPNLKNNMKKLAEEFGANIEVNGDLADFLYQMNCVVQPKRDLKKIFL